MSRDLVDLLRETAPVPTRPLDAPALVQRAARQRRRTRAAATALVACIVFIGVAGVVASDAPDVAFGPNASAQGGGDETGATGGTVPLPPPGTVAAEWVNGEPVWVSNDGGTPVVLDAVNPHEWYGLDELVGWCAASESFEAWFDWSLFDESGRYLAGPAPTGLPRYPVESAAGGTLLLGAKSAPGRSTESDEASVPACRDEGGDESGGAAAYHSADGSDRRVFEGVIVEGDDGVARLCTRDDACAADALHLTAASGLGDEVVEATLLARSDGAALLDVLLLPPGNTASTAEASGLPCPIRADVDYPREPTFGSPEAALRHALRTEPQLVTGPEDVDEYKRVRRSKDAYEFRYYDGDDLHHVWGVTRERQGRWGMTSRGGCVPD